jgi:tetratricopeptide (TPR) repeat protein
MVSYMKMTKRHGRSSGIGVRAGALFLLLLVLGSAGWAQENERSLAAAGVSFALGVQAFEDGDFQAAEQLFLEAVQHDPRHGDALHWLGLTDLRLGRATEAVGRLEASLNAEEKPSAGRWRVQRDLRLARAARDGAPVVIEPPHYDPEIPIFEPLPRWEGRAGLVAMHDSNPGLLPEDLLFPLPGHPSLSGATPDEAVGLDVQVEAHPFYSRGWNLGLAVNGQQSVYQDQSDLDFSLLRATASLAWGTSPTGSVAGPLGPTRVPTGQDRFSFVLQGGGAQVWLEGDPYLGAIQAAFALTARESGRTATRLEIEARNHSYSEDGLGALRRSGTEVTLGMSQTFFLRGEDRSLRLGLAAGERRAGRAFDSSSGEALLEIARPLPRNGSLRVLGSWRKDRFDHPESSLATGRPEREDTTRRVTVAPVWRINDQFSWTLRGSHVRRDSNVLIGLGSPLFDYERTTFSLGLEWRP